MSEYKLLTPFQRAKILYYLKKGPAFGDRDKLAEYTQHVYKTVTGRDLKANCDAMMAEWRKKNRGKCNPCQTFIY